MVGSLDRRFIYFKKAGKGALTESQLCVLHMHGIV